MEVKIKGVATTCYIDHLYGTKLNILLTRRPIFFGKVYGISMAFAMKV
jgi:hypothetical protein